MTVTRAAYTDLILPFTLGSSTNPTSTAAGTLITNLYKQAYIVMEGDARNYSATDANISDNIANQLFVIIQSAASRIINEMNEALKPNSQKSMPQLAFNDNEKLQIGMAYGVKLRFPSHEDDDLDETGDTIV